MGSTVATVWSSNDQPPFWALAPAPAPPGGMAQRRFCCPYCQEGPSRDRFRSHLRRHYRAAVRARVRGGLAPRALLAVLRAAAFRDSRDARRRIRRDRRRRGMMVALSPNRAFWAAHRLRGTHPVEIDFLGLGLGLQGNGMLDLLGAPAAAAGISSDDVAASANAPVPAPAADDDGEESVGDQAEGDVDDGSTVATVWSSNDQPPFWALAPAPAPPGGMAQRRFCCPYCQEGPSRDRFRSHLRRHYRAAVRARVRGGLAPRALLAVLRAAAFRDSRDARRRIRRDRRRRGMMVALSPNRAFWAAHRLRGTHPVEIDFLGLGLGLQGNGMLDLLGAPAAAAGISSDDVAASANAPVPAPAADDDGEESVGDQAEGDVDDGSTTFSATARSNTYRKAVSLPGVPWVRDLALMLGS
uniref:C2H2-type domain-containing protein n=1 Tax=Oryza punctata TaxID=4537 RepID=A0A0E0K4F5_ORYPU